jgi:uncharacterized protein (UPF0332 family)
MMPEQEMLLYEARNSVNAARLLHTQGYYGYAASRAYYSMFYIAEAFLIGKGLAFSKHKAVHSAFGQHFVKTGIVPREFRRYLTKGMEVRHVGDYGKGKVVTLEESAEQISHAEEFLELAERLIGAIPPSDEQP